MTDDLHKLKTVSVAGGEVTLRIPARWGVWPDEDRPDFWGCYEKEADGTETDTGTLWIGVEHLSWEGDTPPTPEDMDMRRMAQGMAADRLPDQPPMIESSIHDVGYGCLWRQIYDTEENGEGLRFSFSRFFLNQGPHIAIITMNLVLTHAQINDPVFVELRDIMEREIGAALLDPFRKDDEALAETVLGPLRLCNFGDRVKLTLPEAMSIDVDETPDASNPRWYCRLETDASHAGMFVEIRQMEMRDEDGDPVSLPPPMFQDILGRIVGERDSYDFIDMPDGLIVRGVEDNTDGLGETDEDGIPFRGFRNHVWHHMQVADGEVVVLTVILMLPLPEAGDRPYAALAAYMDGAVKRAAFPGFGGAEIF